MALLLWFVGIYEVPALPPSSFGRMALHDLSVCRSTGAFWIMPNLTPPVQVLDLDVTIKRRTVAIATIHCNTMLRWRFLKREGQTDVDDDGVGGAR